MSSWFTHVTVVPAFTFSGVGEKVKLSMTTCASAATAMRLPITSTMPVPITRRKSRRRAMPPGSETSFMARLSDERCIDDGERRLRRHQVDAGNAEVLLQLAGRHHHRAGALCCPRRRLRERGGARSMKGHLAFHLLHHLVNV